MINVTKTYIPPIDKYQKYLTQIWQNGWLTNNGPLVVELEDRLKKFLSVKHLFFVTNGTIALQIAIKSLELKQQVVTTPFSYVATTSSLVWEGCTPLFADICPKTLNINPDNIEKILIKNAGSISAILAVHVYGNPCDIIKVQELSKKYNIKTIYDAAHAFNVKVDQESILNFGDISILSFHATKVFHTIEGGALITNDDELAHKISYLRNFGHNGQEAFWGLGINGKSSEFQAAMGLCILEEYLQLEEKRKKVHQKYDQLLASLFLEQVLYKPTYNISATKNYGYYPVIFKSEVDLLKAKSILNQNDIFPRRYFYPALSKLPYINGINLIQPLDIAEDISRRVLCLPSYADLEESNQYRIVSLIQKSI